jgi:hypothetical protein
MGTWRALIPQQQGRRAELPPEGTGGHARSALLGAPVSYGRHSPDQVRDTATELADWNPGELPGQVTDQLAAWPRARRRARISRRPAHSLPLALAPLGLYACSGALRYALAVPPCRAHSR